jgi:membrane associated rhomboid family serine protease
MVFPIGDDNTDRRSTPVVTYILIAINVFVFVVLQGMGTNTKFTYAWATVPAEITSGRDITSDPEVVEVVPGQRVQIPGLQPTPVSVYLTLLTSMFMHGGWAHLLGNMWFLFIFGDNIEDDMGKPRYTAFYLLTGLIASLSHVLTNMTGQSAIVPSLGASGAISGVLGAYLILHPRRKVTVILLRLITVVPGWVAVGIWFLFQLISGLGIFDSGSQAGGVAYAAHIGGFIAGMLLAKPFMIGREPHERVPIYRRPTGWQ